MATRGKLNGRKRAADATLDAEGAAAIAQSFKAKRTKPATKRTYSSKVHVMLEWIKNKYPDVMDADGEHCQLPLPRDAVLGFFGHLIEPAHDCDTRNVHADDAPSPPLSASCVEGYRSALVDLYRTDSLVIDPAVDKELKETLDGYLKTINDLKLRGLMDINEGKRYLKWAGYDLLATKLMKLTPPAKGQKWSTGVFAWSFFVLMWNLMSRSDSVDKIMLQHIDWSEDALVIEEQGHKGDQTGAEKYGKHVYANPFEPAKCPVLALAIVLFSCPERVNGRHQLFIGSDSKGRFGRALRSVIASLSEDELGVLGCRAKDLGTHSIRKGSSSYALSHANGPTPVSVFLRMGQSLGQLKDRYIFSGEGADQLCGRMIAGLPFNSERFGVLPPHFEPTVSHEFTRAYWNELVCGFDKYPHSAHSIFPYLLASVVYHESFLRDNLDPNHPIFKARVFANNKLLTTLRSSVVIAIGTSPVSSMRATGIPPHLAVAAQVKLVGDEVLNLREKVEALEAHAINALPDTVAGRVVDTMRQHFVVQGAVPVSAGDLEKLRAELVAEIRNATLSTREIERVAPVSAPEQLWMSWDWKDGELPHAVPHQWEFPARATVKQMWELWYFGDRSSRIRPYRLLSKQHDVQKVHHMRYHRVSAVMQALELIAKDTKLLTVEKNTTLARQISALEVERSDSIFASCYELLLVRLYHGVSQPRRVEELACGTAYNKLCEYRKRSLTSNEE